ncbi:MAG: hypothetical protein NW202_16285 [Nitrospira sp.]|nr:hypothetical protein [Nitrospira sp.]
MPPKTPLISLWDPQLSDREIYFIGLISVHWASMEYEIFMQTLSTFDSEAFDLAKVPKEMNNIQFTGVLALWKQRVVNKARGRRAKTLLLQYERITQLKTYRDALTHGIWHWSADDQGSIKTTRVRKRAVITTRFSAADLEDFAKKIAEVNFCIRFPRGLTDLARARMQQGGGISRRAIAMFTGAPVDSEGFPTGNPAGRKPITEQ